MSQNACEHAVQVNILLCTLQLFKPRRLFKCYHSTSQAPSVDATCPDLYCLNCSLIYSVRRHSVCVSERSHQAQLGTGNKFSCLFLLSGLKVGRVRKKTPTGTDYEIWWLKMSKDDSSCNKIVTPTEVMLPRASQGPLLTADTCSLKLSILLLICSQCQTIV